MTFLDLVLRPRRCFEDRPESVNWTWPLAGFFLFAFATYLQQFVAHEYRVPFWAVVFVIGWVPALVFAAALFVLLVPLWYWPASKLLGTRQPFDRSAWLVGVALLPPAVFFTVSLMALATLKGNSVAAPYPLLVGVLQSLAALWALVLIALAAKVSNQLTSRQVALFALWPVVVAALFGMLRYALTSSG